MLLKMIVVLYLAAVVVCLFVSPLWTIAGIVFFWLGTLDLNRE